MAENIVKTDSAVPKFKTTRDDILGGDVMNTLPVGIRLHGVKKLHASGLKGQGIKIGIIDSGIDKSHVGFSDMDDIEQYWYRYNVDDKKGLEHGTHVAGTIHMMAPSAKLVDYRCFGENTSTGNDINNGVAHAVIQAYLDGCHIINMSCGTRTPNFEILTACKYAADHGAIIICAAGNEGDENIMTNEFCYPAPYPETIAIGAVSKADGLPHAYFSNTNPKIDFAALGEEIVSYKAGSKDKYTEMNGTSMACPHISGLVACLLSEGSEHRDEVLLTEKEALGEEDDMTACDRMKAILAERYTIDIGLPGFDNETGLGFLSYLTEDEVNDAFRTEGVQIHNAGRFGSRGIMRKPTNLRKPKLPYRQISNETFTGESMDRLDPSRRGYGGPPGFGNEVVSRVHPSARPNTRRRYIRSNLRRRNRSTSRGRRGGTRISYNTNINSGYRRRNRSSGRRRRSGAGIERRRYGDDAGTFGVDKDTESSSSSSSSEESLGDSSEEECVKKGVSVMYLNDSDDEDNEEGFWV